MTAYTELSGMRFSCSLYGCRRCHCCFITYDSCRMRSTTSSTSSMGSAALDDVESNGRGMKRRMAGGHEARPVKGAGLQSSMLQAILVDVSESRIYSFDRIHNAYLYSSHCLWLRLLSACISQLVLLPFRSLRRKMEKRMELN